MALCSCDVVTFEARVSNVIVGPLPNTMYEPPHQVTFRCHSDSEMKRLIDSDSDIRDTYTSPTDRSSRGVNYN